MFSSTPYPMCFRSFLSPSSIPFRYRRWWYPCFEIMDWSTIFIILYERELCKKNINLLDKCLNIIVSLAKICEWDLCKKTSICRINVSTSLFSWLRFVRGNFVRSSTICRGNVSSSFCLWLRFVICKFLELRYQHHYFLVSYLWCASL